MSFLEARFKKRIIHSEPYVLSDNSYFTATDYIVLRAVNILLFFFFSPRTKEA